MAAKHTVRIGAKLHQELQDDSAYQTENAFLATSRFLRAVILSGPQHFARIPAKRIKEWFANLNVKYKPCLDALVRHKILKVDKHYIKGIKSRGYQMTEKGVEILSDDKIKYLKTLFNDPEARRPIQKKRSYLLNTDKYKDPFLQYIHTGQLNYKFDEAAIKMVMESGWDRLTKLKAITDLITFAERDFGTLKYNEADARCWNEFAGMKSELRRYFSFGDLRYNFVIDIRSCHPSFLGHFLIYRYKTRTADHNPIQIYLPLAERERSERISNTKNTTINQHTINSPTIKNLSISTTNNNKPHYDGGNSDIEVELRRWNALFADPNVDPRAVLERELGYTRKQAKDALNHTINGSKTYKRFISWFKKEFPKLFSKWDKFPKREVGIGISTFYETMLMQDLNLYKLATELGLHLTYEFDGCGVMCRDNDSEVLGKLQKLISHIQNTSHRHWGIRPVIAVKTSTGEPVEMPGRAESGRAGKTDEAQATPPLSSPSTRTVVSASRRSSNRSSRPSRRHRESPQPSSP